jgi:transcriptional regulator with XRE-family HTH domain
MLKPMKPEKPTETIRCTLLESGKSLSEVAKESGVSVSTLSRFSRRLATLSGDNLDRLLPALGLEIRPAARKSTSTARMKGGRQ